MSPQQTIAHYRIVSKLGEGGMGAVYRATDTKLNREVAIKVLPEVFAADGTRMARFEREAQLLAALNHPNIAAVYGVEQGAIVMELVEGEELKGPLPVDTAIAYARQIAAALEAAHEKGIVHRDLKPANIKVTNDGAVKVLDFGLAKATDEAPSSLSATMSPTMSLGMTAAGMILGTAAYMAPEQARGKAVDKRADIWAFGVVFFELLTGSTVFGGGETASDALAAVIAREPDWTALPKDVPPHVRKLLMRCLRKDPKQRLRDIGEARIALEEPEAAPAPAVVAARRAWLPWAIAAVAVAIAGMAGVAAWRGPAAPALAAARFPLALPEGTSDAANVATPQVVPSPDGRWLAMSLTAGLGKPMLWVRALGAPSPRLLERTEGAVFPFWSPDSQFIGYFAEGKLKKVPLAGGAPQTLCDVPSALNASFADGGSWGPSGTIVYGAGSGSGLWRVNAMGGVPAAVTRLDQAAGELRHAWPQFLPDGRHVLYVSVNRDSAKSAVYIQDWESSRRVLLLKNPSRAQWTPPGYLLYVREGTLFAQPMDGKKLRLTGDPIPIAEDVTTNEYLGRSAFAASNNGVLVYRMGSPSPVGRLAWRARDGKRLDAVGNVGEYLSVRLSPDEKSAEVLVGRLRPDIWTVDLATGVLTRRTTNAGMSVLLGPWSPDSRRIVLNRAASQGMEELDVSSSRTAPLPGSNLYATDWSQDGGFLLADERFGAALWKVPASGDRTPQLLQKLPSAQQFRLAPDGRIVAYVSSESGTPEVVLAAFPSFSEKRQISGAGGVNPIWRKDGKELFFQAADGTVQSVGVHAGAKIETDVPKPLFKTDFSNRGASFYWPTGDGQRFLAIERDALKQPDHITVAVNWTAELKQ